MTIKELLLKVRPYIKSVDETVESLHDNFGYSNYEIMEEARELLKVIDDELEK